MSSLQDLAIRKLDYETILFLLTHLSFSPEFTQNACFWLGYRINKSFKHPQSVSDHFHGAHCCDFLCWHEIHKKLEKIEPILEKSNFKKVLLGLMRYFYHTYNHAVFPDIRAQQMYFESDEPKIICDPQLKPYYGCCFPQ